MKEVIIQLCRLIGNLQKFSKILEKFQMEEVHKKKEAQRDRDSDKTESEGNKVPLPAPSGQMPSGLPPGKWAIQSSNLKGRSLICGRFSSSAWCSSAPDVSTSSNDDGSRWNSTPTRSTTRTTSGYASEIAIIRYSFASGTSIRYVT